MKIAVLLSGGVDSSVALSLLKEQGHELSAFYLKIWLEDELSFLGECPWEEDLHYAQATCEKFSVPLKVISLQKEYHERVVSYTVEELQHGRTPSPDLFCNQRIKFGVFFDHIDKSYQRVATGHYARIAEQDGYSLLKTAKDDWKDQTYFLSHLNQEQVRRALFPIGGLCKSEVRELANHYDLANKSRKDSQGICFLGKIKFNDFVRHHLGDKPGQILEWESKKKLGEHQGFWYHTIGQRRGLGLSGGPWYVVQKDIKENIVYVSRDLQEEEKARDRFLVTKFNWIHQAPSKKEPLRIKIRHGKEYYQARLEIAGEERLDLEPGIGEVIMEEKDTGIAAGQFAVFYQKDTCLGCASIYG